MPGCRNSDCPRLRTSVSSPTPAGQNQRPGQRSARYSGKEKPADARHSFLVRLAGRGPGALRLIHARRTAAARFLGNQRKPDRAVSCRSDLVVRTVADRQQPAGHGRQPGQCAGIDQRMPTGQSRDLRHRFQLVIAMRHGTAAASRGGATCRLDAGELTTNSDEHMRTGAPRWRGRSSAARRACRRRRRTGAARRGTTAARPKREAEPVG